ncbi:MAG: hypothetical protein ACI8X5_000443 [Planctomycetota bacterium]|jgi:hypothetical protein
MKSRDCSKAPSIREKFNLDRTSYDALLRSNMPRNLASGRSVERLLWVAASPFREDS